MLKDTIRKRALFALIISMLFCSISVAGEEPKKGSKYKIIGSVYIMGVYDDLNDRRVSKKTAKAFLHSERYAQKSFVAFQEKVPVGTILTIKEVKAKVWYIPFFPSRYLVHLEPDISQGLDVVLELSRGMEGDFDGLNSEIFERHN